MNLLVDVTLRSSILLVAALGLRAVLWKRSPALRHVVLASGLAAAVAVGPLGLVLPSWNVSMSARAPAVNQITSARPVNSRAAVAATAVATARATPFAWRAWVFRAWLAGFFVTGFVLAAGALRVSLIAWRARGVNDQRWLRALATVANQYGVRRRIVLLQTDAADLLATCGVVRPRVLLPSHAREWSDERIRVVLCHELAHIRRLDWPIQTAAEMLRAVFWFNPLVWIACALLRRDSEQACDDLVVECGIAPRDYATHLLELVRTCRRTSRTPLPVMSMARRSTLERRIADMLNPRLDRQFSIRTVIVACALLLAVAIPTAALRAAQTGPATLSGTVYDVTGAVMPGVSLTLEDVTQMKVGSKTNASGRFSFANVQPGHYTLEASLAGFRTLKQEFDLAAPSDWDRAITLQIGDLRESITVSERRVSTGNAPPAAAAQKVRVGGSVRAPLKTLDVHPVYPPSMRDAGREGVVPIEAIIGPDGTVTSVRVLSAQVHPDFAIAAVDAVRQWRFTPTLLNGSPVEVVMTVSVAFKLSDQ